MISIEGEQLGNAIRLHGRDKSDIVRLDPRDAETLDQAVPPDEQFFPIRQEGEAALEESVAIGWLDSASSLNHFGRLAADRAFASPPPRIRTGFEEPQ